MILHLQSLTERTIIMQVLGKDILYGDECTHFGLEAGEYYIQSGNELY